LDYGDHTAVQLTVRDDGVGAKQTQGGFGLIGLRERVQYLGGELRIHTTDGQGFTLEVKVPG
jgi:signal transduction histidine kinase